MQKSADGSVSFSRREAESLSKVLEKAEELTDQMEAREELDTGNCEDVLAWYLRELKMAGITADDLT